MPGAPQTIGAWLSGLRRIVGMAGIYGVVGAMWGSRLFLGINTRKADLK